MGIEQFLSGVNIPDAAYNRCKHCGNLFIPHRITEAFCSPTCHDAFYKEYHRKRDESRDRNHGGRGDRNRAIERPFVAWDGEGEDGKYTLLANSNGQELVNRDGLSTERCLDFLLSHSRKVSRDALPSVITSGT